MNEIEKMYENAEIELVADVKFPTKNVNYNISYPPFTAEKQIELIKLLAKGEIKIDNTDGEYEFSIFDTISDFNSFEESLAEVINKLWTDMSQEEKQQIKEILSK